MINLLMKMSDTARITILFSGFLISSILTFFSGFLWFVFFILTFSFLGIWIYTNGKSTKMYLNKLQQSLPDILNENSFVYDDSYLSFDFLTGIAINQQEKEIALLNRFNRDDKFNFRKIKFEDLLEVSIYEDGGLVTKVSRGSQVGGALIGGAIAGGAGAIIGGLSGRSQSNDMSNRLSLMIIINDLQNPYHEINFSIGQIEKMSKIYQMNRNNLNKWFSILKVIINQKENESNLVR